MKTMHRTRAVCSTRLNSGLLFALLITVLVLFVLGQGSACSRSTTSQHVHVAVHDSTGAVKTNTTISSSSSPFVITVVSANRPGGVSYVTNTICSLYCAFNASNSHPSSWPAVLVLNTEVPASRHTALAAWANDPHIRAFRQHGLSVITPDAMHSQLHELGYVQDLVRRGALQEQRAAESSRGAVVKQAEGTTNDNVSRFWWRSKEVLDAAYALEAALNAAPAAEYVIFLEDDISLAPGLLPNLTTFTAQQAAANQTVDVMTLFVVNSVRSRPEQVPDPHSLFWCSQGIVFRKSVAEELVPHLRAAFADEPVDWLLQRFIKARGLSFWAYYPNLVQHEGLISSLRGKKQPIRSASFKDNRCVIA